MNFSDRYKQDIEKQNNEEQPMDDMSKKQKEQLQNYLEQMLFKPNKSDTELQAEAREALLKLTDTVIECGNRFYNGLRGKFTPKNIAEIFRTFIETVMKVG